MAGPLAAQPPQHEMFMQGDHLKPAVKVVGHAVTLIKHRLTGGAHHLVVKAMGDVHLWRRRHPLLEQFQHIAYPIISAHGDAH